MSVLRRGQFGRNGFSPVTSFVSHYNTMSLPIVLFVPAILIAYFLYLLQELTTVQVLMCLAKIVSSVPYQYNTYESMSSTPTYVMKQSVNSEGPAKYSVGYKVQDGGTTKVKKEYGSNDYQSLFASADSGKFSFDDGYSSTPTIQPSLLSPAYPYTGQLKIAVPAVTPTNVYPKPFQPPTASNKIFIHHDGPHDHHHHHHDKHHFVHDVVGHYITDVAGHKLKHVGEVLESGALTEPIIHKLSFAKAALLQLLAIIGPLSAIKTIHVVAKASDPHHEPDHVDGLSSGPPAPVAEHAEFHPPPAHYPPTLIGMIMHFVAQLSKFNTEAKLHLIPNLLKVVSYASSSSAHSSGHHHPH